MLLGRYMVRVYAGERVLLTPVVAPLERLIYRIAGIDPGAERRWTRHALSAVMLNFISAATAMAVAIAVMRGFVTSQTKTLGNFHADFMRTHTCTSFCRSR